MPLSADARAELLALAASSSLRSDSARLRAAHADAFIVDGVVDCDRVMDFLTDYSEFVGATPRARRLFVEKNMKL